jgi:hypothetical protein
MSTTDDDTQEAVISARERLAETMVAQIRRRGYYRTYAPPQPSQAIIDLRWAAQIAGRDLSRRTRTYASSVGQQRPGMITIVVAPIETKTLEEIHLRDTARALIEELLDVRSVPRTRTA